MSETKPYTIMPFKYSQFDANDYLLVNEVGEFLFLDKENFSLFVQHKLKTSSEIFIDLKSKHFTTDTAIEPIIELLATKYRTKKAFLRNFTALHMVVMTVRCNHRCKYCHASSEDTQATGWDMTPEVARKVVDTIFQSPSPSIKIEFQGGEPLLNWKTIQEIVNYARKLNKSYRKRLEFVICTNLTLIEEEMLKFIKEHNILVSTSLDGTKELHDSNRIMRNGKSSHDCFLEKFKLTRDYLGENNASALMTTTRDNIRCLKQVVDEYLRLRMDGIFLRAINPFGYAKSDYESVGYSTEEFIEAYKDILSYIININLNGIHFEEFFTTLLLTRILTPFSTGFMDLQSPAGAGISGAIYDLNGDVYPSDESRMLAKAGDKKFLLGNVLRDSYQTIFNGDALRNLTKNSCVEILPNCATCVYQIYCGADPVRNYSEQGDIVGHRPTNNFCKKHKAILSHLFEIFKENNQEIMDVFWSWITRRPLKEIRNVELLRNAS